ncbi:MAG: hypothetical protein ACFFAE_12550 [Candidatus Hodarchaeota archaeon]
MIQGQKEIRKPLIEILKKTGLAIVLNIIIVLIYLFLYDIPFSYRIIGLGFFLVGGIFLTLAGLRDILGSLFVQRILDKDKNANINRSESEYFHGFGKAGEDVIVGIIMIIFSIIITSIL